MVNRRSAWLLLGCSTRLAGSAWSTNRYLKFKLPLASKASIP